MKFTVLKDFFERIDTACFQSDIEPYDDPHPKRD